MRFRRQNSREESAEMLNGLNFIDTNWDGHLTIIDANDTQLIILLSS